MTPLGSDYLVVFNDRDLRNAFFAEANPMRNSAAQSSECGSVAELVSRLLARARRFVRCSNGEKMAC
jgi:hypothetical protein